MSDDILFRRIFNSYSGDWVVVDSVRGTRRPSSAAFKLAGDGLSLYLERTLRAAGLAAEAVVSTPNNAIAALKAKVLRVNGLGVVRDPDPPGTPDPEHPRHRAHCLAQSRDHLTGKAIQRLSKALAAAADLVIDPGGSTAHGHDA